MLLGYGGYAISFGAMTTNSGTAAFLTAASAMANGRTGEGASFRFSSGTVALTTYVEIPTTSISPLDALTPWGVVGVANVQGLPAGTKLTFNGVTQRLTPNRRGELGAWWIPSALASNSAQPIRIYNDVNGSASIAANATGFIGEIFTGRILTAKTLVQQGQQEGSDLIDPTAFTRSGGGQLWQVMRKPWEQDVMTLGLFTTDEAKGAGIVSGGTPAKLSVEYLRTLLSTTPVCAVCDAPSKGGAAAIGGIRYDQAFMQANWMVARPSVIGQLARTADPYWTWQPQFMEAT